MVSWWTQGAHCFTMLGGASCKQACAFPVQEFFGDRSVVGSEVQSSKMSEDHID
jgi:hypothetical protein